MKLFTKVIGTSLGMAAALALSASTSYANLLTDPGFESGAPGEPNPILLPGGAGGGWAVFNDAAYSTAQAESGTYSLVESEGVASAWNFAAAYQVIGGVTAGQSYTLSGDYMATTALSAYNPVYIQLTFFNAAGADVGTVQTGGVGDYALQYGAASQNTWYTATVTATAPATAVYVAPYLAMMENGANASAETIYWDNANMTLVPEPSTLALLGMGLSIPFYFFRRRN
jgi:hypothetical protein